MPFDLLVRGGHLIDPASRISEIQDVAVVGDRVVAVGKNLPTEGATTIIDAAGRYVTPGLIDLHSHVYPGATYWGVDPDSVGPRSGVTTWVDAGSAGAYTLAGLRDFADRREASRVFCFLNISATGLVAPSFELANIDNCDPDLVCRVASRYPGEIRGIKVRMGIPIASTHGLEPLRRAREAADVLGIPIMCHIASGPPSIGEILSFFHAGDILTHSFTGLSMRLVDQTGQALEAVQQARAGGVVIDVGHGSGGFSYETAESLVPAGFLPDVISTDMHQLSINGPMFDLPTCMTKFLHLGMSLEAIVEAVTARPARILGVGDILGTLAPGCMADVAVLTLEDGTFPMFDAQHRKRIVPSRLRCVQTIFGGKVVQPEQPGPPAPWVPLTERQAGYYADPQRGLNLADVITESAEMGVPAQASVDVDAVLRAAALSFGFAPPPDMNRELS
jgi:dihydroorotase